ncbi:hypothetical protein Q5762_19940 [Streptomyces sp. P9(2023)]|uniref:hypothetical protein n=1 Tax=Streptomyces sp. P9(2023) TaxID=3064394 RepID=UPI0028F412E5|nr:hypothetical protein [Streptomyces sp. P9(2023)]MDT9690573.1 hypothetical protein [Streptomyces sp. P9(2023)]
MRHLPPCVLPGGHEGDHLDAPGATWPCLTEAPATDADAAACEVCGSTAGPHVTVTTGTTGGVRRQWVCQPCAASGGAPGARRPVRMCVRCGRITTAPVVVSEVHQNSGPGFNVYACPDCAPHFPPLPDVLHLLTPGWRSRAEGER